MFDKIKKSLSRIIPNAFKPESKRDKGPRLMRDMSGVVSEAASTVFDKGHRLFLARQRKAAVNSLLTTRKLSGKVRRKLMRSLENPVFVGQRMNGTPEERAVRRLTKAKMTQLLKWQGRLVSRRAIVARGVKAASLAGKSKISNALMQKEASMKIMLGLVNAEIGKRVFKS